MKMKLIQSVVTVAALMVSSLAIAGTNHLNAFPFLLQGKSDNSCQNNPDMFLLVDAGLGSAITINSYAGYAEARYYGHPVRQDFYETGPVAGDQAGFITVSVNSTCLLENGVTEVTGALTALETNESNGVVRPTGCKLTEKVAPGRYHLTLVENNGRYSCR